MGIINMKNLLHNITVVHTGYDNLDVSFFCALSPRVLDRLMAAKTEAQKAGEPIYCDIAGKVGGMVYGTGTSGGYAFKFDTGETGATWFVKNTDNEEWNVRVSAKSAALATLGLVEYKAQLMLDLQDLGVNLKASNFKHSIGRVDVAMDFVAPKFEIDPDQFVFHSNSSMKEFADTEIFWSGRKVSSVTVGKMPNRQVIIYDKTKEIQKTGKDYWWDIWNLDKEKKQRVWRVEVRAGKKYLKEKCGITTFEDMHEKIGEAFYVTLQKIRMKNPDIEDRNVTRTGYHPLWQKAREILNNWYGGDLTGVQPIHVLREKRKRMIGVFNDLITGTLTSYAALRNANKDEMQVFLEDICAEVLGNIMTSRGKFNKKWKLAESRYALLQE